MKRITQFAAGIALLGAVAGTAQAQSTMSTSSGGERGSFNIEPYLSTATGDYKDANVDGGFGLRAMFGVPSSRTGAFSRPSFGGFVTYTSNKVSALGTDITTKSYHFGAEGDLALFGAPINNVLDPFISLGAGAYHLSADVNDSESGSLNGSDTKFAVTPGIGTLLTIQQGMSIGARGDIRYPFVTGGDSPKGVVFELGLNFKF